MLLMFVGTLALSLSLLPAQAHNQSGETSLLSSFDYEIAQAHEVQPHRRTIPHAGIKENGFSQLHLTLFVTAEGRVAQASAEGDVRNRASLTVGASRARGSDAGPLDRSRPRRQRGVLPMASQFPTVGFPRATWVISSKSASPNSSKLRAN